MFYLTVKIVDRMQRVAAAEQAARFKNFGHAAARIRRDMAESIERADEPGEAGEPPHTRGKRKGLKAAIRYAADQAGAVIGPRASVIGEAGAVHEFGESRGDDDFPERPFALPALQRNTDRFAAEWAGSIGGDS